MYIRKDITEFYLTVTRKMLVILEITEEMCLPGVDVVPTLES
jgi:hypothetical protein